MIQRWDGVVRITHWCVALGFLINRLHITEPGKTLHQIVGLTVAALVIVRLIWGMTGAKGPARLSAIIPTCSAIRQHLEEVRQRSAHRSLGHNPIGAMSIWLFWFLLPLVALTGWAQDTALIDRWPVDEWHYWLVNSVTVLVGLHILAVVALSLWLKRNLIAAMLPGRR
ncbi:cytochrome b/b6 domain-containing protein [Jinshanibacter sp. LJY008]|uniref:Cytochrome b/b6 domain-containing protein n=1 Tax=Limnobaculum eriocheiris TaxID=2897391 RepID=A0A9X1MXE2_9GAMM|nr:cytochrome b/b6 domain-containing protein [Limnobaculum eriocheiris]MCD1125940.1 cytochrome b/b6 domain-containing protein [Limnobaculum eriocheiris]